MKTLLVALLIGGALALGFVLGRSEQQPAPRETEPERIVEREVVVVPAGDAPEMTYGLRDVASVSEFLQTFGTRAEVDDHHAQAILEQCATVYGRTSRRETRIALMGALWKEQGGRFRGDALDTLIAIEPNAELRARMETQRTRIGWGQIADLDDVLAELRGSAPD